MDNTSDNKIQSQAPKMRQNGDPARPTQGPILLQDGKQLSSILGINQDTHINDLKACQDGQRGQDDCGDNETSSVLRREKSKRLSKKPKRLYDDETPLDSQQSAYKRQKYEADSMESSNAQKIDKDDFDNNGVIHLDNNSDGQESKPKSKTKQKHGHKKQNFTAVQTQILKRWFIQNADNPYLKEENRKELSEKTGLDQRQVSNWFTNVRKRVWQPLKKKNKNKSINEIMLKVKLKLEADPIQQSGSVCSSSEYSDNQHFRDGNKGRHGQTRRRMMDDLSQMQHRQMIEEASKHPGMPLNSQMCQNQLTAGHNPFNLQRAPSHGSSLTQFQHSLMLSQLQKNLPSNQQNSQIHQIPSQNQSMLFQQQQPQNQQQIHQNQVFNQTDKFIMQLLDQFQRKNELQNQQNQQSSYNNLPKNLQSILKDPNSTGIKPQNIIQQVNQVQKQLLHEKQQSIGSLNTSTNQQVGWQPHQLNSILSNYQAKNQQAQSAPPQPQMAQADNFYNRNTFQHQSILQHGGNNLQDLQFPNQSDIQNLKMRELQQKLLQHSAIVKGSSPTPNVAQQIKIGEPMQGQLQQIQSELMQHTLVNSNNINLQELQESKPQDNIINTQATQKESGQEDLRSLASKFQMSKNLIDIDFKKNEKDQSFGHSVVEKDKGGPINYGVMSDTSLQQASGHRLALKKFLSKKLRFQEKMKNVMQWRTTQLDFAEKNKEQLQDPAQDELNNNSTLDADKLEMIEKEFIAHQKLVEQMAKQKAIEKESENKNMSSNKLKQKERNSSGRRGDGFKNDEEQSNEGVEVISIHHSKSLINNRSLSIIDDHGSENNLNTINAPFQFIPIVLVSCPTVVKGGECKCGYDGFYPANDFYKNQLQQFISNQSQLLNPLQGQRGNSSNNNSGGSQGTGGTGRSGCAESGNGRGRGGSTSNTNGNSWQTTANYPHPFLALLNQFNQQSNMQNSGKKNKSQVDPNIQSQLSGVRNVTDLIQKLSNTFTQYKAKDNKSHENGNGSGATQATINQASGTTMHPQSVQQDDSVLQQVVEGGVQFQKPQDIDRRDNQKQLMQPNIPPQVNIISHLEQASLLKNQLEVLNEITNQFHELMRLDKIKQKIVQFQKDKDKEEPKKEENNAETEQVQAESSAQQNMQEDDLKHSAETLGPVVQMQNKAQYQTSDNEQVNQSQPQTLKQRIQRNSRTMSDHKSSQNQSFTNVIPPQSSNQNGQNQTQPSSQPNQDGMIINQLRSVLSALYNSQQKQTNNLQIVQMLKDQHQMTNRQGNQRIQQTIAQQSMKSTRPTDGVSMDAHNFPSQSGNLFSNKNMRTTDSVIMSSQNNNHKNIENDQMQMQTKQINQSLQTYNNAPQQSKFETHNDTQYSRQNQQNGPSGGQNSLTKAVNEDNKFNGKNLSSLLAAAPHPPHDKQPIHERTLPSMNALNMGSSHAHNFDIHQQIIKNGGSQMVASAQKNNLMNGTSNEHEAPMQNAAKAANPPTNGVNLNDQDLYQLLQRLPLDRSNHNV